MKSISNQKKIMIEKEFAIKIADDESIKLILLLLNEDVKNGNSEFKRFKFKQILNRSRVSKKNPQTPWEYLCDVIVKKDMECYRGEEIVRAFLDETEKAPSLLQYFTLRKYDYSFFENNFEKMIDNVKKNNHFFYELDQMKSEDIEGYYTKKYSYSENEINKKINKLENLYLKDKKQLNELKGLLKGITLQEYDKMLSTLEKKFDRGIIQLVFLLTGDLNYEIKSILFTECLYSLLLNENCRRDAEIKEIKNNFHLEKDKLSNQNKEYKKNLLELEKKEKILSDKIDHCEEIINLNLKNYEEEKKQLLKNKNIEYNQLQNLHSNLIDENNTLTEKLSKYKLLESNYCLSFAQDFKQNKIAVIHASPLLYAKHLFPDINFISASKMMIEIEKYELNLVYVQNSGIDFRSKMELRKLANIYGYEIIFLDSKEERELIMVLSNELLRLNKE